MRALGQQPIAMQFPLFYFWSIEQKNLKCDTVKTLIACCSAWRSKCNSCCILCKV